MRINDSRPNGTKLSRNSSFYCQFRRLAEGFCGRGLRRAVALGQHSGSKIVKPAESALIRMPKPMRTTAFESDGTNAEIMSCDLTLCHSCQEPFPRRKGSWHLVCLPGGRDTGIEMPGRIGPCTAIRLSIPGVPRHGRFGHVVARRNGP